MRFRFDPIKRGLNALKPALFVALALASCDEEKAKNELREIVDVQGTCSEDLVGKRDEYAGKIFRWQSVENGTVSTYGALFKTVGSSKHPNDATQPSSSQSPSKISFSQIDTDITQPRWTLHGLSSNEGDLGESMKGYASTCEVEVVNREQRAR